MPRASIASLLTLSLGVLSCQAPPPPPGNGGNTSTEPPAFTVSVFANRTTGVPGTAFNLSAQANGNAAPVVGYTWTGSEGIIADGQSTQVSFDAPGDYVVDVTAQDQQGQTTVSGIYLKVFDPNASTGTVARTITPSSGQPGTFVQLTGPALLDRNALITVKVGNTDPVEPFRPDLGQANLTIPFDADDGLNNFANVSIQVFADGRQVDQFDFTLSPTPPLKRAPGELARQVLLDVPTMFQEAADVLPAIGEMADLNSDEVASLLGLLEVARMRAVELRDSVGLSALDQMDSNARARIDEILVANGVEGALQSMAAAKSNISRVAKLPGEDMLQDICVFQDVMRDIQNAMQPFRLAAPLVALAGLAGGPVSGAFLIGFANMAIELGVAADIAKILAKIIPKVEDQLIVTATPSTIPPGSLDPAIIRVKAKIVFDVDLCRDALYQIIGLLANELIKSILPRISKADLYSEVLRRSPQNELFVRPSEVSQALQEFSEFIEQVIEKQAAALSDIAQLDSLLAKSKIKLCDFYKDKEIPIQPTTEIVRLPDPTNAGALGPYNEDNVHFTCNPAGFTGTATIRIVYPCGAGNRKLEGSAEVTCGMEPCTEDASNSIRVDATPTSFFNIPSSCGFVKEMLDRQDAAITVTNTHATRTIKIAAVLYRESDRQQITRGPCQADNLIPGETLEQCLESRVAGCDHALSGPGVGFSGFLRPGETSLAVPYICSQEFIFVPFGSNGTCGESLLETVTENWIVQAVFCDNNENAEKNFCPQMDLTMKTFGQPSANWGHIEKNGCP